MKHGEPRLVAAANALAASRQLVIAGELERLLAGGANSIPASPHFGDQAEMYTKGKFKDVLFYKEDVLKNAERTYIPGQ